MKQRSERWRRVVALSMVTTTLLVVAGCATRGPAASGASGAPGAAPAVTAPGNPVDPFENWNRKVFGFNEVLDENVMIPVARTYQQVVPSLVRRGVSNVFGNFADAWSVVNALLQGKVAVGMSDLMRFLFNTTFGFAGALDIASEMGLPPHYEDFGQTLGTWGVASGPYIVWPLLGPSALRETVALPLDRSVSPALVVESTAGDVGIVALQIVNARANLLGASRVLDDIALDKYSFVRDAYLARRRSLVYDGNPPDDDEDDAYPQERYDLPEEAPAVAPAPAPAASAASAPATTAPAPQ